MIAATLRRLIALCPATAAGRALRRDLEWALERAEIVDRELAG